MRKINSQGELSAIKKVAGLQSARAYAHAAGHLMSVWQCGMGESSKPARAAWRRAGARFTLGRALLYGQMVERRPPRAFEVRRDPRTCVRTCSRVHTLTALCAGLFTGRPKRAAAQPPS